MPGVSKCSQLRSPLTASKSRRPRLCPGGSFSTSFNFPTADFIVCDTNSDGEVSSLDINAILAAHDTTVEHFVEARDETGLFDLSVFTRRVAMDDANICTAQCTTPVRAAEVSLSVADSPDPVNVGRDLTYTLRVSRETCEQCCFSSFRNAGRPDLRQRSY